MKLNEIELFIKEVFRQLKGFNVTYVQFELNLDGSFIKFDVEL